MRYILVFLCFLSFKASAENLAEDLHESVATVAVTVKDLYGRAITGKVVVTQFKPDGAGPFPIAIINHGRSGTNRASPPRFRYTQQARFFIERGFAVFVPTRLGYGDAGVDPDPEDSGRCSQKFYAPMAEAASTEVLAVLEYAKQQAYADPARVLIVGQSVGGYTTTAVAAKNPAGLVGAINFSGGSGGDPVEHPGIPCQGFRLEDMYARFGATSKVPMLWIYTENDLFFNPTYSQAWHAAFTKAGGQADFRLLPPYAKNGHMLFVSGIDIWGPIVAQFLEKLKFGTLPSTAISGT
jgi:dienelactone hydrolase